jgi:hypothetical protein
MPGAQRHRFSIELTLAIFVLLHALFALEVYLDLRHSAKLFGASPDALWQALRGSAAMARTSATTVSRAYNVLVSLVLTSIAIAVPLTANMYTPKLIDIFVRDRINLAVMIFFVLSSANAIWASHATWDQGPLQSLGGLYPRAAVWIGLESMTLGWSILIPWFLYVFRFLDPANIIRRVVGAVAARIERIDQLEPAQIARAQVELDQQLLHLGNVILRAVDRADRDVTLDAIASLKQVVSLYQQKKPRVPAAWLEVPPGRFVGLADDAIALIQRDRIWVEHKCLHQLHLAYNASLAKMQDAISHISDVNRELVLHAESRGDEGALKLGIRYFNTFIREGIRRKDPHAIFDVFYQYKELGRGLIGDHPWLTLEIGHHLKYYADVARLAGLPFIHEQASYDLESVIETAYERGATVAPQLLEILVAFDATPASVRLVKSKLIAGGFFRQRGLAEAEARVRASLASIEPAVRKQALAELLNTTDPIFWEVTDRQTNFDYVDEARKRAMQEFSADAAAGRAAGAE